MPDYCDTVMPPLAPRDDGGILVVICLFLDLTGSDIAYELRAGDRIAELFESLLRHLIRRGYA
jgi:hypothetical protein